jgi:hypothetical protein
LTTTALTLKTTRCPKLAILHPCTLAVPPEVLAVAGLAVTIVAADSIEIGALDALAVFLYDPDEALLGLVPAALVVVGLVKACAEGA